VGNDEVRLNRSGCGGPATGRAATRWCLAPTTSKPTVGSRSIGDAAMPEWNWRDHAACRDLDGDLFFPVGSGNWVHQVAEAQAVCARCPVITQCRQWAVTTQQTHGVWGGRLMGASYHDECRHRGCDQPVTTGDRCPSHTVPASRDNQLCSEGHLLQRRSRGKGAIRRYCPTCAAAKKRA
jgi:hypothetical protein